MSESVVDAGIVCFRSEPALLTATIASLLAQPDLRRLRILVNDTDDVAHRAVVEAAASAGPSDRISIDRAERNLGFAAGHNRLLAAAFDAGATHAVVVNPDLPLAADALAGLVKASEQLGRPALVSGVLLLGDRATRSTPAELIDSAGIRWTRSSRHLDVGHGRSVRALRLTGRLLPTAAITGALILASAATHRELVLRTGEFFDEDFFAYREDAELGLRAQLLGIPSVMLDLVVGVHYRGSPGTTRHDPLANRLSVRNRFLLAFKYGWTDRPGQVVPTLLRDVCVALAVLTVERGSRDALPEAWRLRRRMRAKRRALAAPHGPRASVRSLELQQ